MAVVTVVTLLTVVTVVTVVTEVTVVTVVIVVKKTPFLTRLKNANCDKTLKLKLRQNSKTQIMTKL